MHTRALAAAGDCAERKLPYEECGKLVVAVDAADMGRFDKLEDRGVNGVPRLRRVDGAGITEVSRTPSVWLPCTFRRTAIMTSSPSPGVRR